MRHERLARRLLDASVIVFMLGVAALLLPQNVGGHVSYVMVSGESMEPGLRDGDLVLVREADHYEIGDSIAFTIGEGDPGAGSRVIHRITGGNERDGYVTQGDNRDSEDLWRPTHGDVVGRQWIRIPGAGRVLAQARAPLALAALAALATIAMFVPARRRPAGSSPSAGEPVPAEVGSGRPAVDPRVLGALAGLLFVGAYASRWARRDD